MRYVEMTLEEALRYNVKTVLVAVQDLEMENECISFERKDRKEYEKIVKEAETLVSVRDDFANQIRAFSKKQTDIRKITPHGKLSTILLKA